MMENMRLGGCVVANMLCFGGWPATVPVSLASLTAATCLNHQLLPTPDCVLLCSCRRLSALLLLPSCCRRVTWTATMQTAAPDERV